jgi:DNA-binding protein HU-beta
LAGFIPANFKEAFILTKTDLIDKVAKDTKLTKKDANGAIDAVIDAISRSLAKGDKVTLVGFGSFEVKKRNARTGRNPQTGAEIKIAARKVPVFKAGKALKDAVAKK